MTAPDLAADLQRIEPDRFGASLTAPAALRPRLWTLYALNHELARAPLQTNEPLLAQMRLQWWVEQLQSDQDVTSGRHDLLPALAAAWGKGLPQLAVLASARFRDCERLPFTDADEVEDYIHATATPLMRLAIVALEGDGLPDEALKVADAQALGAGILAWLAALPQLAGFNLGLAHDDPAAVKELARRGRAAVARARDGRGQIPRHFAPALFRGADLDRSLRQYEAEGQVIHPPPSEFRRRLALARLAITARWWD